MVEECRLEGALSRRELAEGTSAPVALPSALHCAPWLRQSGGSSIRQPCLGLPDSPGMGFWVAFSQRHHGNNLSS